MDNKEAALKMTSGFIGINVDIGEQLKKNKYNIFKRSQLKSYKKTLLKMVSDIVKMPGFSVITLFDYYDTLYNYPNKKQYINSASFIKQLKAVKGNKSIAYNVAYQFPITTQLNINYTGFVSFIIKSDKLYAEYRYQANDKELAKSTEYDANNIWIQDELIPASDVPIDPSDRLLRVKNIVVKCIATEISDFIEGSIQEYDESKTKLS